MPTYVYKNLETAETYEIKQGMRDDALSVHPETGAPIKRILSAPGIAFRGSGFYANDSRPRSEGQEKGQNKSESQSKSEAPAKAKTGSEGKSSSAGGGGE
jgi:predicted nucleic acid-binding Zn ribbon protein